MCVQIWKPGNNHSTKLNIIAIFPNYCIIPIQSMHDFLIHKIHIWKWKKEFRKFGWILNEIDLNVAQQYGRVWFNQSKKELIVLCFIVSHSMIKKWYIRLYPWLHLEFCNNCQINKSSKQKKSKNDELSLIKKLVLKSICLRKQIIKHLRVHIPKWLINWLAFILHLALFVIREN